MNRKIEREAGHADEADQKTFALSVSTGTIRRRRVVDITYSGVDCSACHLAPSGGNR
jgi:hypothetical protein